jgi:uncharacterized FlaG/YvyC family protein
VSGNLPPQGAHGATAGAPAANENLPVKQPGAVAGPAAGTSGTAAKTASGHDSQLQTQSSTATNKANPPALVAQLNKYLNDSGRAAQFRVDPASQGQVIQEVNPATGDVIGQYSAAQFPELARSLGISGVLVDSHA